MTTTSFFYQPGDGFLHRVNPLSKVMATVPPIFYLALTTEPWTPLAFVILAALTILILGRIPFGRFFKIAGPMSILMIGYLVIYPLVVRQDLVSNTPLVFDWGRIKVYQGGLLFGLATGLRIYSLIILTLIFSFTTDATDFIRALVQQWKLPYRLGYGAMAAFRFVPMLQKELKVIQAAHRIRGVDERKGFWANFERMRRYAIPLLATAIRSAERTALAMDGRAFGAFDTRTYYKKMTFGWQDYLFVLGFWGVSVGIIFALRELGLSGPLVF
ncbi:MAG: energy-coupling factor transporter transmembrane component T, partial [Chloroflexota bacterium]